MTDLKKDMIEHSLPSPIRFLNYVKENNVCFNDHVSNWKEVKSKDLFDMFCCWCIENNEKKMSNTAFGKIVNTKYEKKRTKSGFVYDLEDMKTGV